MTVFIALLLLAVDPPTPAIPRASWITPKDYPAALVHLRKEGRVAFRLTFDKGGRLRDCTIVQTSDDPLLDATACRLTKARFRAKKGEPRVQFYQHAWTPPGSH